MPEHGDWIAHSRQRLAALPLNATAETAGKVTHIADGIAMVSGLPDARLGELLKFDGGQTGFAMALDRDIIGTVLFDSTGGIDAGTRVTGTGEVLRVPVGPGLLGRVVDPLGRPLDGGEAILAERHDPTERDAPAIIDRDLVQDPVETGVLVVDALFALGRGQRELIIGDRATGKTALAVEAMVAQKNSEMICIYIAVGQRISAIERTIAAIRKHGAPERTIFVVASAASPPGLQWIAPAAGMTIAEYFRDNGGHALVVIDDLSKHAATHRELSLLTRSPPGREAYPGDIFYQHAHLLERAAHLSAELGGGSLSALPIIETDAGNLSAYIPTNVISITDGQIVLDSRLFAANQRPAVDVGLSVSRVGGKTQKAALRDVSGKIRLDYAQFLELEIFTRFGGISDKRVMAQIQRGERIRALLAQPRFESLRMVDQVALLAALNAGVLDDYSTATIGKIRSRITHWLDSSVPDLVAAISDSGEADETVRSKLADAVRALATLVDRESDGAGDV
ncbi:F0F1 ATP synthase subunit alpha [Croceicoccus estronivorus]|uniref:F0F1 ATP synthase subunit alpha n=1 Tax=Croceicoccus estronivorus TaxID=1172626 RepID=UPI000835FEC6|nr:F0F1 ATP synthase subunit alpha [Croceicoccus estronivorus]OCC25039.1 F0F1 ATP synthase subunit alpha [Croceicoccus estronivorus]